jgi:hypothetical protein
MKADAAVQGAGRRGAADRAVRRARGELDTAGNEFIGAIDAQKNKLTLEEARRRLAQLEEDVKSRAATNQASLAVVEKRNKAQLAMQRAQQVIDSLVIQARRSTASSRSRRTATRAASSSPAWCCRSTAKAIRSSGPPVADVIESGRMEVRAKIDETDRDNLQPASRIGRGRRAARARRSARRSAAVRARQSRGNFFETSGVTRQFDVTLQFDQPDPR